MACSQGISRVEVIAAYRPPRRLSKRQHLQSTTRGIVTTRNTELHRRRPIILSGVIREIADLEHKQQRRVIHVEQEIIEVRTSGIIVVVCNRRVENLKRKPRVWRNRAGVVHRNTGGVEVECKCNGGGDRNRICGRWIVGTVEQHNLAVIVGNETVTLYTNIVRMHAVVKLKICRTVLKVPRGGIAVHVAEVDGAAPW